MKRGSVFEALLQGSFGAPQTESRRMSRDQLLRGAGITARQLTYYIRNGVVSPPVGRTRSATYTVDHQKQIRRVLAELAKGKTVREIAEVYASGSRTQELKRQAVAASRQGAIRSATIHFVCDGIFVVAYNELLPSETAVLKRILKAGERTLKERTRTTIERQGLR